MGLEIQCQVVHVHPFLQENLATLGLLEGLCHLEFQLCQFLLEVQVPPEVQESSQLHLAHLLHLVFH